MVTKKKKAVKRGRKTNYKKEYSEQVFKLCLLGATDKEIGNFFEVTETTINNWKISHPDFFESIKNGKMKADAEVAEALYNKARGFRYNETTFEKLDNKENLELTTDGEILINDAYRKKIVTKQALPDTGAAFIWLKNRKSGKWQDKQVVQNTGMPQVIVAGSEEAKQALEENYN